MGNWQWAMGWGSWLYRRSVNHCNTGVMLGGKRRQFIRLFYLTLKNVCRSCVLQLKETR
jgi:deoxyribodipyrimidine photolyase